MHVSVSTKFFSKYAYVHLARIDYIYVFSLHPEIEVRRSAIYVFMHWSGQVMGHETAKSIPLCRNPAVGKVQYSNLFVRLHGIR